MIEKTKTFEQYTQRIDAHGVHGKNIWPSTHAHVRNLGHVSGSLLLPRQVKSQVVPGARQRTQEFVKTSDDLEVYVKWFRWGAEAEVCIWIFLFALGLTVASLHYAGAFDFSLQPTTADNVLKESNVTTQPRKSKSFNSTATPRSTG